MSGSSIATCTIVSSSSVDKRVLTGPTGVAPLPPEGKLIGIKLLIPLTRGFVAALAVLVLPPVKIDVKGFAVAEEGVEGPRHGMTAQMADCSLAGRMEQIVHRLCHWHASERSGHEAILKHSEHTAARLLVAQTEHILPT